jgi:signal peptide peptidase SppA
MPENPIPLFGSVWALRLDYLRAIASVVQAGRVSSERLSVRRSKADSVAVIPIVGAITQRGSWFGPGAEDYQQAIKQAVGDSQVSALALEIDSPGGEVYGVQELGATISEAKASKPVVAVANAQMASASYWLGSQATELWVTPSGEVGSVGVIAVHEDWSRALDQEGVTVSLITAGEGKGEGNPFQPLDEESRSSLEAAVGRYYTAFVADVAKGRMVSRDVVRSEWKALMYGAKEAVANKMADAVGTRDEAIMRAASLARTKASTAARAELDAAVLMAARR